MRHRIVALMIPVLALFLAWGLVAFAAVPVHGVFRSTPSVEVTSDGPSPADVTPPHRAVTDAAPVPTLTPIPQIEAMLGQVVSGTLYQYVGDLSGAWPVTVGGEAYTLTTRYTYSGEPVLKATQFVSEHLAALGLEVEVHYWRPDRPPNVVGELRGERQPEEIVILSAHLDSWSGQPMVLAPGADDNASGVATVLLAADILSQYRWNCTLRFSLWTGEEQGLLGSNAYAQRASDNGEQIVGVLNLDMIGWDGMAGPDMDLHANQADVPASMQLAELFAEVVEAYNVNLQPEIIPAGIGRSDHVSFWSHGYAAILGIEDYAPDGHDFNPYYHTTQDLLQHLDMDYFTEFATASVGTFAHMGGLLLPGPLDRQILLPLVMREG